MSAHASPTGADAPERGVARPARLVTLIAVAMVLVGSFLPWVHTPVGNVSGARGAGLWTAYAAFLGLAAVVVPWRRLAVVSLAVLGVVAVALPVWQVVHVLGLVGLGGWLPGTGLVMVLAGGVVAAIAARRTWTA